MKLCELRKEPYIMAELYKIVEEKLKKDGNWPDDLTLRTAKVVGFLLLPLLH